MISEQPQYTYGPDGRIIGYISEATRRRCFRPWAEHVAKYPQDLPKLQAMRVRRAERL